MPVGQGTNKSNLRIPGFYSNHIHNLTINAQPGYDLSEAHLIGEQTSSFPAISNGKKKLNQRERPKTSKFQKSRNSITDDSSQGRKQFINQQKNWKLMKHKSSQFRSKKKNVENYQGSNEDNQSFVNSASRSDMKHH